jgi:hypothetical protein
MRQDIAHYRLLTAGFSVCSRLCTVICGSGRLLRADAAAASRGSSAFSSSARRSCARPWPIIQRQQLGQRLGHAAIIAAIQAISTPVRGRRFRYRIRLRAERRAGQLLTEREKVKGTKGQLIGPSTVRGPIDDTPTLSDLGVSYQHGVPCVLMPGDGKPAPNACPASHTTQRKRSWPKSAWMIPPRYPQPHASTPAIDIAGDSPKEQPLTYQMKVACMAELWLAGKL